MSVGAKQATRSSARGTGRSTMEHFRIKDCALIALSTGYKSRNLRELRDRLSAIDTSSLEYHFWGGLLRAGFEEREYVNDFAEWIYHELREKPLAERLAIIDPSDHPDNESLRQELINELEEYLDTHESMTWAKPDKQFEFLNSQIVVFSTNKTIERPEVLPEKVPHMSASSIFYHFIDARRRAPDHGDDFRAWLAAWGEDYMDLRKRLADIEPYFTTLIDLRQQIAGIFQGYFEGRRA
jgi:hypothetical protein